MIDLCPPAAHRLYLAASLRVCLISPPVWPLVPLTSGLAPWWPGAMLLINYLRNIISSRPFVIVVVGGRPLLRSWPGGQGRCLSLLARPK